MRVKALKTFTEFHNGSMVVLNAGDVGEISDRRAAEYIDANMAEAVEPEPEPESDEAPAGGEPDAPVVDETPAEQPEPQDEAEADPEPEAATKPKRGRKPAAADSGDEAPAA